jgi:hypothetical protein
MKFGLHYLLLCHSVRIETERRVAGEARLVGSSAGTDQRPVHAASTRADPSDLAYGINTAGREEALWSLTW